MKTRSIIYAKSNKGETLPGFLLTGVIEEMAGISSFRCNQETLYLALTQGAYLVSIELEGGYQEMGILNSTFNQSKGMMNGQVVLATDIEAISEIFKNVKEWPFSRGYESQYFIDHYIETCNAIGAIIKENNMSISDKLDRWFESEEGKFSIEKYRAKIHFEDEFKKRWEERIISKISYLSDDDFDVEMTKFINWEKKYREMLINRHIECSSNVFGALCNAIDKLGEEVGPDEDDMFFSGANLYRGYKFTTYCGQGCFTAIEKEGKRLL